MPTEDRRTFIANTLLVAAALGSPPVSPAQATEAKPPGANDANQDPTWLVIYSPGPRWIANKPLAEQPLRPHGRYMLQLYREGALRSGGGFADSSGGAASFTAPDAAAALAVVEKDPAVVDGIFTFVLRRWNLVDWAAVDARASSAR